MIDDVSTISVSFSPLHGGRALTSVCVVRGAKDRREEKRPQPAVVLSHSCGNIRMIIGYRRLSRNILRHLAIAKQHSAPSSRAAAEFSSVLVYDYDTQPEFLEKTESSTNTSVANPVDCTDSKVWGKAYDLSTAFDNIIKSLEVPPLQNPVPRIQPEGDEMSAGPNSIEEQQTAHHEYPQSPLYARQLDIEHRQMALANINTVSGVQNLTAMGRGANLKAVQRALLSWYEPFIEALNKELVLTQQDIRGTDRSYYGPVLCVVPVEKLAVITIHATINSIMSNKNRGASVGKLTKEIASAVEMECNVAALAADKSWLGMWQKERITEAQGNPRAVRNMGKRLRKYLDQTEWCTTTKMKVGGFLISTFIESAKDEHGAPSLVHASPFVSYRKQVGMVKMTEEVYDSIAGNTLHFGEPTYLPMIVPPVPWKSNLTGGYFTLKSNILRFRSKSQLNVIRRARMQPVLDGLNFLAQIPWRVNLEVFETIKVLYARGETVEGIPSRVDVPLPSEAECYVPPDKVSRPFGKRKGEGDSAAEAMDKSTAASDDHLVFDQSYFNYVTKKVVQKNMATHSLRCDLEIKLRIAEEFKNDDMYFPWNMDFRGRAYPIPQNFNHMGSDLCRGLLKFADSKPLGPNGLDWLKCHLCNLCGNNKISMADRVAWADAHMDEIVDSATNPVEGKRWWAEAENPFQALAACVEIHKAIASGNPETFKCSLPVHQDGSCNGLQHYAAMGKDKPGGQAVNLLPSEKPQDVYSEVLVLVLDAIEKDCEGEVDENNPADLKKQRCARTIRGKVDRKVIKQTVMTSVYGVTPVGARLQIGARLREKLYGDAEVTLDQEQDQVVYEAAHYLANVTIRCLGNMFYAANEIMEWLGQVAVSIATQGHAVSWVTPLGLPVMQPYRKVVSHTVKTMLQSMTLSVEDDALPVSGQKQRSAFPPNYVHSLDSTHMLMTAMNMKKKGLTFSAVHDSYWTHACDVDVMNAELRDCFVELYSLPLLENLRDSLQIRYPGIDIPDIPARGELELEKVKESTYFFH